MTRKKKWLAGIGIAAAVLLIGLTAAGIILKRRFEPYIRRQAIFYLRERFQSEVQLAGLHVSLPQLSPLRWALTRGRGTLLWVDG